MPFPPGVNLPNEAKINAVIRQMAMDMLTNRISQGVSTTQGPSLASELVTLLGGQPIGSIDPPTSSVVPPAGAASQSPVSPPVSNAAADVTGAAGVTQGTPPIGTVTFIETVTQPPLGKSTRHTLTIGAIYKDF